MELPRFLLADNSNYSEDIFVVHTQYPRFIINMKDDELTWFEEFEDEDLSELETELPKLMVQVNDFYDNEINHYKNND